jgi:Leucine-rich repeat (LRR) protein
MKRFMVLVAVLLLLLLSAAAAPDAAAAADAAATGPERTILMEFYTSTQGEQWILQQGWGSAAPHCDWHGVTCNAMNQTTVLTLYDNNIAGPLPESLMPGLPALETLYFSFNKISGELPASLCTPGSRLQNIWLKGNALEGAIPDMSACTELLWLDLHVNLLSGTVPDLSASQKLRIVRLDDNLFTNARFAFAKLANLEQLFLFNNRLQAFPELANCVKLQQLFLDQNEIAGALPAWLPQLTQLVTLRANDNYLVGGLPPALAKLTKLEVLLLSHNQLGKQSPSGGLVPAQWQPLVASLSVCSLSDNGLATSGQPGWASFCSPS